MQRVRFFTIVFWKTAENTTSGVKVSWGKVSGASGYKVYRKTSDGWKYLGKTEYEGGTKVCVDSPIDVLPYFIKA